MKTREPAPATTSGNKPHSFVHQYHGLTVLKAMIVSVRYPATAPKLTKMSKKSIIRKAGVEYRVEWNRFRASESFGSARNFLIKVEIAVSGSRKLGWIAVLSGL